MLIMLIRKKLLFSSCLSLKCILDLLNFLLDFAYHFSLIKYFISFIVFNYLFMFTLLCS